MTAVWSENEVNLLQQIKELRDLVSMLLLQTGLDQAGLERAFELAKTETAKIDAGMIEIASERFLQTPEGNEAHRLYEEERKQREKEAWRETCREDGQIYPYPNLKSTE